MDQPAIEDVFTEFLAVQRKRRSAAVFRRYQSVMDFLRIHLNNYGYEVLSREENELFDCLYNQKGDAHREFCQIFGPRYILPNLGMFLSYFMVRKVMASKALLRAAGTVTKTLAKWLADKGYADAAPARAAQKRAAAAARDLPKADALADRLAAWADGQPRGDSAAEIEGHFEVRRIEPGKLWLQDFDDGRTLGPVSIPVDLSRRTHAGWTISGILGRARGRWTLVEVWNVYPN